MIRKEVIKKKKKGRNKKKPKNSQIIMKVHKKYFRKKEVSVGAFL